MPPDRLNVERVHQRLIDWYASHGRELPWRRTRDPYAILVAEIMLQQTQVERVIPKWHAWLERFPNWSKLAASTKADAIRAWQGLGYNMRALRLHGIACQVVSECGGVLPRSVGGLMALQGVGRYTASAVACFSYEQPVAIVDTNVRRVLSRVFAMDPSAAERVADAIVPIEAAYCWNQALMDLGATICRARRPLCLVCPLVSECGGPGPVRATSRATATSASFIGSRRYVRGRVIDALRALGPGDGLSVEQLAGRVGVGTVEPDAVGRLVGQLASEGLVRVDEAGLVRLPN